MQIDQNVINRLIDFKRRDKFSVREWEDRGLNPSDDELCQRLASLFNSCADSLIQAVTNKLSGKELKLILKSELVQLNKFDYDSSEREFIGELFFELGTIVNVDIKDNLNKWLYGSALALLLKMTKELKLEKIVDTLTQPCNNCGIDLESLVLKRESEIPNLSWMIIRCNNCNEFNLLSLGPGIKELKFGNYQWVETLRRDEFTQEEAQARLEQIKFFRR